MLLIPRSVIAQICESSSAVRTRSVACCLWMHQVAKASAKYLDRLEDLLNKGKLPPSIMYKGKFYEDADELRAAHPQLRCLV